MTTEERQQAVADLKTSAAQLNERAARLASEGLRVEMVVADVLASESGTRPALSVKVFEEVK